MPEDRVSARMTAVRDMMDGVVADLLAQGVDRLPSERELAQQLGVTRSTLRRALDRLEQDGVVTRRAGRAGGAYLTESLDSDPVPAILFSARTRKVDRDLNGSKGIPQLLAEQGFVHRTEVLKEETIAVPSSDIGQRLRLADGAPVVSLLRLRLADDVPLSLERMFVDPRRFPGLLDHAPIRSLYSLLADEYGVRVDATDESIDAIGASQQVASLLGIRRGFPVFVLRRTAFDLEGAPIETSVDIFRTDRSRLRVGNVFSSDPPTER